MNICNIEDLRKLFIEDLGYSDNGYLDYDKRYLNMEKLEEIEKMHLLSEHLDFKIWVFELNALNYSIMNRVSNRLYNINPFEYNLLIFTTKEYRDFTFLHYQKAENRKLRIRRLNIEDRVFTKTDFDILKSISVKGKNYIDSVDLELEYRKAFNIEKVTKEFFREFKRELEFLEKNIEGLEKKEDKKSYSILLMNRIIFLYFIQKKGWLNDKKDYLYDRFLYCENMTPKLNYYEDILKPLFFECLNKPNDRGFIINRSDKAKSLYENFESQTDIECGSNFNGIPYLNGQLFEPNPKYEINSNIKIKNEVFEKIFKDLLNKYNFTVREDLGYDTDVAVDPELLGRIFENMINENERGKTGSFYTPRPIINYMCKESLIEFVKGKHIENNNEIRDRGTNSTLDKFIYLIKNVEDTSLYTDNSKNKPNRLEITYFKEILKDVKICDPAVGSGAYILGMLQLMTQIKSKLEYYGKNININLYETKKEIIEKNLYGVDIQKEAVTIAHLRLWLSLAVEYEAKDINDIKPLPNLNYKIVHGNSLVSKFGGVDLDEHIINIGTVIQESFFKNEFKDEITSIIINKKKYFSATDKKKDIEDKIYKSESKIIEKILKDINRYKSKEQVENITKGKELYMSWILNFPDIFIDNKESGFDILIGNPPYVSSKDVNKLPYKKELHGIYGYKDDLYNYFIIRSFSLLKDNGILSFITSDTFLTIGSKLNLREKLQNNHLRTMIVTPKAFDALVDTVIFTVRKASKKTINYDFKYIDAKDAEIGDFLELDKSPNVKKENININIYKNSLERVFFIPNELNMQIYRRYMRKINRLFNKWWTKIDTSRKIQNNHEELEIYRKQLKPGDLTLLGLITEGGQGLATGDNSSFVGVIKNSKEGLRNEKVRIDRFYEKVIKDKDNKEILLKIDERFSLVNSKKDLQKLFSSINEQEIRWLFDELRRLIDHNLFGRAFIYRIIDSQEVSNVYKMTEVEMDVGIDDNREDIYVPYDKGDRDGNRWYLETPYYIKWNIETVKHFVDNSGKTGRGMPVIRNKRYYFREGFCWTDVNSTYLKARKKSKSVYDVLSMSLFNMADENLISENYIVALINSKFMSEYVLHFLNGTSHFQINDARKLPIIIPKKEELNYINGLVERAIKIQEAKFKGEISDKESQFKLFEIQEKVDSFVDKVYEIER